MFERLIEHLENTSFIPDGEFEQQRIDAIKILTNSKHELQANIVTELGKARVDIYVALKDSIDNNADEELVKLLVEQHSNIINHIANLGGVNVIST